MQAQSYKPTVQHSMSVFRFTIAMYLHSKHINIVKIRLTQGYIFEPSGQVDVHLFLNVALFSSASSTL